jgi:L-cysteine:1D-myo-inositol 2-amino-2-deoxy-alpha-D-glucopyranoside ligase
MDAWTPVTVPVLPAPPDRPAEFHLFDTAQAATFDAAPAGSPAAMYVCGITPYDATHLGHASTYLTFDLIQRVWRDLGHDVLYVQNVTDVDDPLLDRASRTGENWMALAEREIQLFREDMTALRVIPPAHYIGAVEAISEITEAIESLLKSAAAYRVDDDIYFSIEASGRFGYESGYDRETMRKLFAERGGDPDHAGKRDPLDSLLWRGFRTGEPYWDTALGRGRPGWHIECSVIALNRLGMAFDIQGGGSDLIFPHHEHSAAHAEALTDEHPFARHYVHTGMVGLDGEKMSKSRGNLVFVSKLRGAGVDPMAIRLALLDGHYRADREWTGGRLPAAEARLKRWRAAMTAPAGPDARGLVAAVRQALADDLNTAAALTAIDRWTDGALAQPADDQSAPELAAAVCDALLGVAVRS